MEKVGSNIVSRLMQLSPEEWLLMTLAWSMTRTTEAIKDQSAIKHTNVLCLLTAHNHVNLATFRAYPLCERISTSLRQSRAISLLGLIIVGDSETIHLRREWKKSSSSSPPHWLELPSLCLSVSEWQLWAYLLNIASASSNTAACCVMFWSLPADRDLTWRWVKGVEWWTVTIITEDLIEG